MVVKVKYDKDKGLVQSEGSGFEVEGQTTLSGPTFVSSSVDGGRFGVGIEPPSSFAMHIYNDLQPAFRLQRGADPSTGVLRENTYYEVNCGGNGSYFYSRHEDANGVFVWTGYDGTTYTEYGRFTGNGRLGIGVAAVDASAKLEIESTTEGFLPPRMTTTQRDAISTPAAGLIIYNTTTNKLNFYNGSAWEAVTSST